MLIERQYASECLHAKMFSGIVVLSVLVFGQVSHAQIQNPRGPPRVETNPIFLDSFIPASMQIIAHITELMKFDLKPQTGGPTTSTTTTMRPTRPHKPAVYAPDAPPGPDIYFAKGLTYEEYVERLKHPSGSNYFDIYSKSSLTEDEDEDIFDGIRSRSGGDADFSEVSQDLELSVGKETSDLLKLVNKDEEIRVAGVDVDRQVQEFSQIYDDSDFRFLLLRQKRQPPTRAYVALLFLYDLLNKESKKLGLNKYNGYSQNVLNELVEFSSGTSADQLKAVLSKVRTRQDTKNPQILKKIDELLKDLEQDSSYINAALRYIPPLSFVL